MLTTYYYDLAKKITERPDSYIRNNSLDKLKIPYKEAIEFISFWKQKNNIKLVNPHIRKYINCYKEYLNIICKLKK